ncbi:MAG: hypothetical protein PHQ86_06435 [Dehalococcoidales bacterium]|nr:hypothetical protein [Dehalococcoidales bacterium]
MNEPTKEQIKEFWRWCGFKHIGIDEMGVFGQFPNHGPGLDLHLNLNNLFEYAVPEVMERNQNFVDLQVRRYIAPAHDDLLISYTCEIWSDNGQGSIIKQANTPALALFWAIWGVIKKC